MNIFWVCYLYFLDKLPCNLKRNYIIFNFLFTKWPDKAWNWKKLWQIKWEIRSVMSNDWALFWPLDNSLTFTESSLKKTLKSLLNNCHFKLVNKVFRQAIGIPMGLGSVTVVANMFSYYYDLNVLKQSWETCQHF